MLTRPQDLHTGQPPWSQAAAHRLPVQYLTRDIAVDVVVIGAGISGALMAEELTRAGLSVAMLDRRGAIRGSTAASTALLIHEIDTPLSHLVEKIGQAKAVAAWQRSKLWLESLIARIHALNIDCALERRPSVLLSGDLLDATGLAAEAAARSRAGLPADYLTAGDVADRLGITGRPAIVSQQCATVDPVAMTSGFLKAAVARGLQIYAPVTAEDLHRSRGRWQVSTADGPKVTAQHVVYASGYEIPRIVHTRRHRIKSTWVIATRPQPQNLWLDRSVIWEASDTYLYLRSTPDGRIICGGEDEDFSDDATRDALLAEKTAILEKKLQRLMPHLDCRADYSWTGSFGASTTGLPSLGAVPGMKNVHAVMAYGGNGINFSRIGAEIVTARILGRRDSQAALFAFEG